MLAPQTLGPSVAIRRCLARDLTHNGVVECRRRRLGNQQSVAVGRDRDAIRRIEENAAQIVP